MFDHSESGQTFKHLDRSDGTRWLGKDPFMSLTLIRKYLKISVSYNDTVGSHTKTQNVLLLNDI